MAAGLGWPFIGLQIFERLSTMQTWYTAIQRWPCPGLQSIEKFSLSEVEAIRRKRRQQLLRLGTAIALRP